MSNIAITAITQFHIMDLSTDRFSPLPGLRAETLHIVAYLVINRWLLRIYIMFDTDRYSMSSSELLKAGDDN